MSEELPPGEEYANWQASETEQVSPGAETSAEGITDPEEIHRLLAEQYAQNHLLLHQTSAETADQIVGSAEYFTTGPGIGGSVVMLSPEQASTILPELDKNRQDRSYQTHKGADGAVVMVFPRDVIQEMIESGELAKDGGVSTIDDILADKASAGEIAQVGLPNRFLYGSYHDATLRLNPNYNPVFDEPVQ